MAKPPPRRDDERDVSAQLACPHCKTVLPENPPGTFYCGRCGKPFTVPGPDQLAREAKKRRDEKNVLMLVGAVVFVIYVLPVLMALGYVCFMVVIYLLMFLGFGVAAIAGG